MVWSIVVHLSRSEEVESWHIITISHHLPFFPLNMEYILDNAMQSKLNCMVHMIHHMCLLRRVVNGISKRKLHDWQVVANWNEPFGCNSITIICKNDAIFLFLIFLLYILFSRHLMHGMHSSFIKTRQFDSNWAQFWLKYFYPFTIHTVNHSVTVSRLLPPPNLGWCRSGQVLQLNETCKKQNQKHGPKLIRKTTNLLPPQYLTR